MSHKSAVGARIRALREERNLTVGGLASTSGVSARAIAYMESGRSYPSVPNAIRLAAALGVTVEALLATEVPAS